MYAFVTIIKFSNFKIGIKSLIFWEHVDTPEKCQRQGLMKIAKGGIFRCKRSATIEFVFFNCWLYSGKICKFSAVILEIVLIGLIICVD